MDALNTLRWNQLGLGALAGYLAYKLLQIAGADADMRTLNARLPKTAFRDKVVWITGASSGIGKALAFAFAKQNAKLILSSRRKAVLEEVADSLPTDRSRIAILPFDMEDLESLPGMAEQALKIFGRIDVVVNNAGVSTRCAVREAVFNDLYPRVLNLDFFSHAKIAHTLAPHLSVQPGGAHIVNISSACGRFGAPLRSAYCAAKHAMQGYFNALRLEEPNIRVTTICPGFVRTEVSKNAIGPDGKPLGIMDELVNEGMSADRAAHLILAAVYNNFDESWIGGRKELLAMYVNQYLPTFFYPLMQRQARKLIAKGRTMAKTENQK